MLLAASKKLNRRLYVLREQTGHDYFRPQWMIRDALFTFWRGQAATTAFGARWHGTFEHMLKRRSKLDAAPRPRKRKSKDSSMAAGLRLLFGTEGTAAAEAETDDGHLPHIPNAKTKAAMREPTRRRFRSAKALSAEQMIKWIVQDEEAAAAVKILKR
jgi:nucleoid-associated protein YgaU